MKVIMSQKEFDILKEAREIEDNYGCDSPDTYQVSDRGFYIQMNHWDEYLPIKIDDEEPITVGNLAYLAGIKDRYKPKLPKTDIISSLIKLYGEDARGAVFAIQDAERNRTPVPHWCGLSGFGAINDVCPACYIAASLREEKHKGESL